MSERDCKYAKVLIVNDKVGAKGMVDLIDKQRAISETTQEPINWKEICSIIEYPYTNVFNTLGVMREHFRRLLIELKTLSIFGKHNFAFFNNLPTIETMY